MVVETLWPDSAPWWLNLFIWMATFWQYILFTFVPAFYVALTWLFGMQLLQRWPKEVAIILYPTKVEFGKITQQYDPYFRWRKGIYWLSNPLQPKEYITIPPKYQKTLDEIKIKYETLAKKEGRTEKDEKQMSKLLKQQIQIEKRQLEIKPLNPIHIYTHAVNQPVTDIERRATKVDEILHNNSKPKAIKRHGIWMMKNPKLHFHRHFKLVVSPDMKDYVMIPVKEAQDYSIGFFHTIGISLTTTIEVEDTTQPSEQINETNSGKITQQLVLQPITTNTVLEKIKQVQDYQNFSASRAYNILFKRRSVLEDNFSYWITGSTNPLIFIVLIGGIAAIALMMFFFHGQGGGTSPTDATGAKPWL